MTCEVNGLMALGEAAEKAKRLGFQISSVACTGATFATAASLTGTLVKVTGASAGVTDGVKLPAADLGTMVILRNAANAVVKVYGNTATDKIWVAGADAAVAGSTGVSLTARYNAVFFKHSATEWFSLLIPALASL